MNPKNVIDLKLARQCLLFRNTTKCDDKECKNMCCPLNKFWDDEK